MDHNPIATVNAKYMAMMIICVIVLLLSAFTAAGRISVCRSSASAGKNDSEPAAANIACFSVFVDTGRRV
jgi:hypothetical protein